jgi:hypothetical protein
VAQNGKKASVRPDLQTRGALVCGSSGIIRQFQKGCSRKPGFRYTQFSEIRAAPVLLARVPPDRTPLYRTGYERYSPSFLEYVDTREDGSQEARSPGPRVEGRTVASPGITVAGLYT